MENKIEIKRDLAHVDYESGRYQTMKEHSENVANYAAETCSLSELKILVSLIGVFHDVGKLGRENQEDFERILQYGDDTHKHGLDHSTAGGRLIRELLKEKSVSEFISTVIYFHHGMGDCINLDNGQSLQQQRDEKQIDYDWIKKEFFQIYDKEMLEEYCKKAIQTYKEMEGKINIFHKESEISKRKCGNRYFFMGMYLRMVLSLLIDGDWTDTACFFQDVPLSKRISLEETQKIWNECIEKFEQYMSKEIHNNPSNGNVLNTFRQEISDLCRQAADKEENLYRLTVPTGAGKTLSSLRFALYHAKKMKKQHIIYIAPFNSILIQNAEEIRKAKDRYKEEWNVALDKKETDRNYLYGRLLAVADRIEYLTYDEKDNGRVTNAKRYMSTFSQRPYETWKVIEENIRPYLNKLDIAKRTFYENLLHEIDELFDKSTFTDNSRLEGLWLYLLWRDKASCKSRIYG